MPAALSRVWRRLSATPWATALGLIAVLGSVRNLVDPTSLVLREAIGPLAFLWSAVYGGGGAFMLWGTAREQSKFEAAGNALVGTGALVQAVIQLFFLGVSPYLTLWTSLTLFIFGVAAVIRVKHILSGRVLILAERL